MQGHPTRNDRHPHVFWKPCQKPSERLAWPHQVPGFVIARPRSARPNIANCGLGPSRLPIEIVMKNQRPSRRSHTPSHDRLTIESFLLHSHPKGDAGHRRGVPSDATLKIASPFGQTRSAYSPNGQGPSTNANEQSLRLFEATAVVFFLSISDDTFFHDPRRCSRHRRQTTPHACRHRSMATLPWSAITTPSRLVRLLARRTFSALFVPLRLVARTSDLPICAGVSQTVRRVRPSATSRQRLRTTCCRAPSRSNFPGAVIPRRDRRLPDGASPPRPGASTKSGQPECLPVAPVHFNAPIVDASFFLALCPRVFSSSFADQNRPREAGGLQSLAVFHWARIRHSHPEDGFLIVEWRRSCRSACLRAPGDPLAHRQHRSALGLGPP